MVTCCAIGCTNRTSKKIPGITFHRFPQDKKRLYNWIIAVRRRNWAPTKYSRICSEHFISNDFLKTPKSIRIKEDAVPSVFIFKAFPNYLQKSNNEEYLYSPEIVSKLDFQSSRVHFDPPISITNPGENLYVRPLCLSDYHKGYLDLLSQLTRVGDVSETMFKETFEEMKSCKNGYFITVIEDLSTNQIVGTATLAIEKKFIHSAGLRGRLEDVVVSSDYRGKQLGKLIVITIKLLAEHIGCYKITLDCKDKMIKFYKQFGFICETGNNNMMTIRFKD